MISDFTEIQLRWREHETLHSINLSPTYCKSWTWVLVANHSWTLISSWQSQLCRYKPCGVLEQNMHHQKKKVLGWCFVAWSCYCVAKNLFPSLNNSICRTKPWYSRSHKPSFHNLADLILRTSPNHNESRAGNSQMIHFVMVSLRVLEGSDKQPFFSFFT